MLFLAGLMGYGVFQAYDNILQYRIIPSQNELAYIKKQLRRQDLYRFQRVHFIRPDPKMYEAFRRYDEFGVPTTAYKQDIPGILKCALREIGLEPFFWYFYPRITQGASDHLPIDAGTLIIDMNDVIFFVDQK